MFSILIKDFLSPTNPPTHRGTMSNVFESPPVLTGKRKRTAVSYVDTDDILDEVLSDVAESSNDENDIVSDDDGTFGSRRKIVKKSPPKKKSKKASKVKKESPFRFLDLPPELRDMIYEMTMTDVNGVSLVPHTKGYRRTVCRGQVYGDDSFRHPSIPWRKRHYPISGSQEISPIETRFVPALLAVNKQIQAESINFLYNQHFIFQDTTALHGFLATIGPRNLQRLQSLEVMGWGHSGVSKAHNNCALTLLAGATNLKSLALCCDVKYWSEKPRWIARRLYRDAHHFLEAYGFANGRKDAAVDILHIGMETFRSYWSSRDPEKEDQEELEESLRVELRALLGVAPTTKKTKD